MDIYKMITDRMITVCSDVYGTKRCDTTVGRFLGSRRHRATVDMIRSTDDKAVRDEMKRTLPQAFISGTFENGMREENLAAHSGLICIDIDQKDNPSVTDWPRLRDLMAKSTRFIGYLGLSASGHGLWGIIPIKYPERHREQFLAIEKDFLGFRYYAEDGEGTRTCIRRPIIIDHGYISVAHKRAFSYDADAYLNEDACVYEKMIIPPRHYYSRYDGSDRSVLEVRDECERIKAGGIDVTANYDSWYKIGLALASLGEDGRQYYHMLSSMNPKYRESQTDKKFDNLLRTRRGDISLGTFFEIARTIQQGNYSPT